MRHKGDHLRIPQERTLRHSAAPIAHKTDGINLQKQGCRTALGNDLGVENVCLTESLLERMNAEWAFVQQVA